MKLLILGSSKTIESELIYKEAKRRKHFAFKYDLKDVLVKLDRNNIEIKVGKRNLNYFDAIIFRGISKNIPLAHLIALHFSENKKGFVLDKQLVTGKTASEKLLSHYKLLSQGINCPKTFFSINDSLLKKNNFKFPLIAKDADGRKGENIFILKTKADLNGFLKKFDTREYLIQEKLQAKEDLRIIVVGNKIVGAIKRIAPEDDFRTNVAIGGRAEIFDPIPRSIGKMALTAARIMNIDFAGVDIMLNKGKPYVLEVNRTPQFRAFYKTTDINPATTLLDFIEKKIKS